MDSGKEKFVELQDGTEIKAPYIGELLSDDRSYALNEIISERERQDRIWGGPEHDDKHSSHDWVAFIVKYLGNSVKWPFDLINFRDSMVKIAALSMAALEWSYRNEEDLQLNHAQAGQKDE